MSATPLSSEEKDPTCVVKMLESLTRKNHRIAANLGFGLGASGSSGRSVSASTSLGLSLGMSRRRGAAVATRLKFDDTFNTGRLTEISTRKRGMDSVGDFSSLDILSSVEKKFKVDNMDSSNVSIPASPWEYRSMKADLLSAKSQIEVLENRNHQLHALRREQELVFENEKASFKLECDGYINRIKDLENRVEILKKRRYECKEELEELKGKLNSLNNDSSINTQSLQKRMAEVTNQLHESELKVNTRNAATERRETELEMQLNSIVEMAALQEKQMEELSTNLQDARREQAQMEQLKEELQESKLKIKSLESEKEDMKEAAALASAQKQKLLKFPEMERELTKFREETARLHGLVQNKLFLEEMVTNLESRLASSEERDREYVHLQARVSCLESSHNEWLGLAKDLGSSARSPSSLRIRFEHLQQKELQLTAESADLKSRLKAALESKSLITAELENLKAQFEKQKVINEQQSNFLHRQKKKLNLISQERDYYRSQLDSYEKDLTISTTSPSLPTSQQDQNRSRIALLEKTLQGYHELVEKMENDKEKKVSVPTESLEKDKIQALEAERDTLMQQNLELKQKQDELELELQYRALKGDFNPTKTKVLHFKNNPKAEAEAQRQEELFALRAECNKLRERIRVLSDGQSKDVTLIVEGNVKATHSKEVQVLQDEVSTYKVKLQRLKEAFKKTSNEFREVVYQVLGYRIDWKNTNQYHLSSMYAESADDILIFQYNSESAGVNMLETPFSNTLTSLIDLHLRRQKSIPVFLSAVTLDLFSQQTMATVTEPITLAD